MITSFDKRRVSDSFVEPTRSTFKIIKSILDSANFSKMRVSVCLLDIISNSKTGYQKKLFLAYRKVLEQNIDAVDQRIDEL
jgi:hypothetical protein